ncbi:hypothetical protein SEUCBS139899_010276 [Sporothrix eucalyptigena]|uniref:Uncharacterized protein n=1 Tax=Sporothrix eucalyptigena TaxID=1812306 RepID=A0ABP0CTZ0_9PEZI
MDFAHAHSDGLPSIDGDYLEVISNGNPVKFVSTSTNIPANWTLGANTNYLKSGDLYLGYFSNGAVYTGQSYYFINVFT